MNKVESNYYFCYNKKVMEYLRYEKGIKFITAAKQIHSDKVFYLFERNTELDEALKQLN
jgi:hypothetical protein